MNAPEHDPREDVQVPAAPEAAGTVFGDRLPLAVAFCEQLATTGVSHGLIGPREVPRLWERHILNCAVVAELIPAATGDGGVGAGASSGETRLSVIDVGSGAGLPGLALAIARPDLHLHLVEPMLRRTTWLQSVVDELALDNVTVHRGRAEEFAGRLSAPVVTARAVARIDRLAAWCLPLLDPAGVLLALKGSSAQEELDEEAGALARLGATSFDVVGCGDGLVEPATVVARVAVSPEHRPGVVSGGAGAGSAGGRARDARKARSGKSAKSGRAERPGQGRRRST
ncbi:16S rRNA (guanine(527)-N(7))-methyltransferase RsmG [Arsenicicoccus piscis]|nr:16S rRNA (guanine(527)-N(7))-methyltransferase RsmG [Arsenicicoccus piscis]MCH8627421.1 16S rRNA (guanine(527)-N(7))-methyltransferase RsmG [Arsenicicoccus piscis]